MFMLMVLFVIFQLKHFLADYPLQIPYMLGKFKPGWGFLAPLSAHCAVHGVFTLAIVWTINPSLWWLSLVDFGAHFLMDLVKANPKLLGRFKALSASEFRTCAEMASWATQPTGSELQLASQTALRNIRSNKYFWWCLGLDQMVHHLTHYYIIWKLVDPVAMLLSKAEVYKFVGACEVLYQRCGQ